MGNAGLVAARVVATTAHRGQVDKAGQPYIDHPRRVADRMGADDTDGQIVAWLHDVVEDTALTQDNLIAYGFARYIRVAVDAITRRPGEPPNAYYARVSGNPIARRVKRADIDDNTDPRRLLALDSDLSDRLLRKYAHALDTLDAAESVPEPRAACPAVHPSLAIDCARWDRHNGKHQVIISNATTGEISLREWE